MKRDTLGFRIGRLLLWLGMILLLMVAGVGMLMEQTLPRQNGTIPVAGTKAPIEIGRDAMGVVTVRASSETDAAFALGYAHAQDRLFQMDLTRRLGAGRLSEVIGPRTLHRPLHAPAGALSRGPGQLRSFSRRGAGACSRPMPPG